ncbi:hypothetical protein COCON_G00213160, partial [Conger conger]
MARRGIASGNRSCTHEGDQTKGSRVPTITPAGDTVWVQLFELPHPNPCQRQQVMTISSSTDPFPRNKLLAYLSQLQ